MSDNGIDNIDIANGIKHFMSRDIRPSVVWRRIKDLKKTSKENLTLAERDIALAGNDGRVFLSQNQKAYMHTLMISLTLSTSLMAYGAGKAILTGISGGVAPAFIGALVYGVTALSAKRSQYPDIPQY